MKVVVFLGPSLPLEAARRILPEARFMPPARQADIISVVHNHRPAVIALIDGVFNQALSVWHKEILFALQQGVLFYGAASMGALRAAETAAFGARGVGWVYEQYAGGALTDDDEVALLHGEADSGYYQASQPMVNLRRTLALAREQGIIDAAWRDRLVALGKDIFYPQRTMSAIIAKARQEHLPEETSHRLERFAEQHYVDIKARDAELLLETIRDLPETPPPPEAKFTLVRSHLMDAMYDRDRWVEKEGVQTPLYEIAEYAALHMPEFNQLNFAALNRALVVVMADMLEVTVDAPRVEHERVRLRRRLGLADEAALDEWARANDLSREDLDGLLRELALCRRLHAWLLSTSKVMKGSTKIVLNELRLRDQYVTYAKQAAQQGAVAENRPERFVQADADEQELSELIREHLKETPCLMDAHYGVWARESGFGDILDLRYAILRSRNRRQVIKQTATQWLGEAPGGKKGDPN